MIADEDTPGREWAFAETRARVVERLRARRGELVEAIFARVRGDEFGAAGAQDAEYVAGLRAAVGAAVEYGLEGIERGETDGSPPAPPIPLTASEQARRAARVGVSLDTVLRRYVLGSTLLGDFLMQDADREDLVGRGAVLREVLASQAAVLDRMLAAITAEYARELERVGRSPERRRAERVRGLLEGGTVDGAGLDYELDGWHLGVLAVGAGAERAVRDLAVGVDRRLLSVAQDERSVWAWLGGRERSAFMGVEPAIARLIGPRPPFDPPVVLALGEPARGLRGWRVTHKQAQAALAVALRRGGRESITLTRYADVALLASALKDEMLAAALLDVYIAPLEDSRGGGRVLRETLRAYLAAERNISSAAAALKVIRKTVETRLRTIEQKLGRTLHPCPAELEVALELAELADAPDAPDVSIIGDIVT